jgi:hypothetical protein
MHEARGKRKINRKCGKRMAVTETKRRINVLLTPGCQLLASALLVRKGTRDHKDVKNEGRSGNIYENKGMDDILPDQEADRSA